MNATSLGHYAALLAAGEDPRNIVKVSSTRSDEFNRTVHLPVLKLASALFDELKDTSPEAYAFRVAVEDIEKGAAVMPIHIELAADLADATTKSAAGLAEAASWVPAVAAMGGGSLGALYWALNRDATSDDATSERTRALRDYYRRVGAETKSRVQRRTGEAAPSPSDATAFDAAHDTINALSQ
jgi:hypothetical protein